MVEIAQTGSTQTKTYKFFNHSNVMLKLRKKCLYMLYMNSVFHELFIE